MRGELAQFLNHFAHVTLPLEPPALSSISTNSSAPKRGTCREVLEIDNDNSRRFTFSRFHV